MFDLSKIIGLRLALQDLFIAQEEEVFIHVQVGIYNFYIIHKRKRILHFRLL